MKKFDQLYFLAIVPPSPIKEELVELKSNFASTYSCKAALKSPPHITLHMPFRFPLKRERELLKTLETLCQVSGFELDLHGFGAFPPRVIYINVKVSDEIVALHDSVGKTMKTLQIFNRDYKDLPFHPHVTIAFRDLKKSIFPLAWEEYESKFFERKMEVNQVCLLKHNGSSWEEYHNIELAPFLK